MARPRRAAAGGGAVRGGVRAVRGGAGGGRADTVPPAVEAADGACSLPAVAGVRRPPPHWHSSAFKFA